MSTTTSERDEEVIQLPETLGVLDAQTRGEIDVQIATAKRYPRSIRRFKETALEMATLDEETAASCIYALPRDGRTIEGPSARLAEIIVSAWGNARAGARTVSDEGNFVIAQGAFHDLEHNVAINFEVRRRITNKHGVRYSDDMVSTTANAACSIALRNAVLKGVPKAFWNPIYEAAKKTAVGDAQTLANRRAAMLAYFQKMNVTNDRVFALLNDTLEEGAAQIKGVEDITLDQMATLKGLATAIKEGDTTVDQAFPARAAAPPPVGRVSLKKNGKQAAEVAAQPVPTGAGCQAQWEALRKLTAAYGYETIGQAARELTGDLALENHNEQQLQAVINLVRKWVAEGKLETASGVLKLKEVIET